MNTFLEELSTWVELSGEALCAAEDGLVVLQNRVAVQLLGDHRGESLSSLLPDCPMFDGDGSFAATLPGDHGALSIRGMRKQGVTLLNITPTDPPRVLLTQRTLAALRNNLFLLQLPAERLLSALPEKEDDLYAASMRHAYYALRRLLDDFSDLDAVGTGTLALNSKPLDLAAACHLLIDTVRCLLDEGAPVITEEYIGECVVNGDRRRLEQVLMCLLSSALLRAAPDSHIRIRLSRREEKVLLTLEDDGAAVSPEQLKGMFSMGDDAPDSTLGTGLGLVLAWNLVQLHGGRTIVESREEQGTRVHVELPASSALPLRDAGEDVPPMSDVLTQMSAALTHRAYRKRYTE